jgi:hypothetical protein
MIKIKRMLPGELEGDVNPEDFGFTVTKSEWTSREESVKTMRRIYEVGKQASGVTDPRIEKYIEDFASGATEVRTPPRRLKFRLRRHDSK